MATESLLHLERSIKKPVRPDQRQILSVLPRLYQAALQPDPWPQILSTLAALLSADKAMFTRLDRTHPRDSVTETIGMSAETQAVLLNRNLEADPIWFPILLAQPIAQPFDFSDLVPPEMAAVSEAYVRELSVQPGLEQSIGAVIENNAHHFAVFGVFAPQGSFDDGDRDTLRILTPHIKLAWEISQRVAVGDAGQRDALASFELVHQAMVVLDRSGYAMASNAAARRLLASAEGMQLRYGRFIFDTIATQTEFERAVRTVISSMLGGPPVRPQELRVPRRSNCSPYALTVVPLNKADYRLMLSPEAGCVVALTDYNDVRTLPVAHLSWLYRLTPAEVRICESLHQNGSVDAVTRSLNLTRHTVRSHLKNIYTKMGVSNQSQLLQRLINSVYQRFYEDLLSDM